MKANWKNMRLGFTRLTSRKASGRMSFGQMRKHWSVLEISINQVQKIKHVFTVHTVKHEGCIMHRVSGICAGYHEISRPPRHSAVKCAAQCQKAWSQSTGHWSSNCDNEPKHSGKAKSKTLDYLWCHDLNPIEHLEGAEICSVKKTSFKPETPGAVCSWGGLGQNSCGQV